MPGICTSIRMTSKRRAAASVTASLPVVAAVTSWPRCASTCVTTARLVMLSSTTSTSRRRDRPDRRGRGRSGHRRHRRRRRHRCQQRAEQLRLAQRLGELGDDHAVGEPALRPRRGASGDEEDHLDVRVARVGRDRARPGRSRRHRASRRRRGRARNGAPRSAAAPRASIAADAESTTVGAIPQLVSRSPMTARAVALSSTASTRWPRSNSVGRSAAPAAGSAGGKREATWNWLPCPGSLVSQMRPPISSTSWALIVSPRPVPPNLRLVDASACAKAPKICHCWSGAMPMPESRTVKCSAHLAVDGAVAPATSTSISPRLGELDRVADEVEDHLPQPAGVADQRRRARRAGSRQVSSRPFSWARPASSSTASSIVCAQVESRAVERRARRPRSWRSRGCR